MKLHDEELHLLDYWRVFLRRRYIAIAFFAGIVGIVSIYSFAVTPVYKGTAQILIKMENNPTMTFTDVNIPAVQQKDSAEYYHAQIEIIKSRVFADRVVRKLQLDRNAYFLKRKDKMKNSLFLRVSNSLKDSFAGLFSKK